MNSDEEGWGETPNAWRAPVRRPVPTTWRRQTAIDEEGCGAVMLALELDDLDPDEWEYDD